MKESEVDLSEEIEKLLLNDRKCEATTVKQCLQSLINTNLKSTENIECDLVDLEFLEDVKYLVACENIPVFFGRTIRNIKFLLMDDNLRQHEIFITYKYPKKIVITSVNLPYSPLQDCEYGSLREIVQACRAHVESLNSYFCALECIDRFCTVMEPLQPTFKDDFRRILLDERTWLHIEVSPEGLATNMHLIGHSELWSNKLQSGLLIWDHDKDIVENIMSIFNLENLPTMTASKKSTTMNIEMTPEEATVCSICLCSVLDDNPAVPLPLCQNVLCGVYFHRNCLFQWLVACSGGRPPAFGVATGSCPACFQTISCNEKDD